MFKRILLSSALVLASSGAFAAAALPWIDDLYNTGEEFAAGEPDTRYSFSVLAGTATGSGGFGVVTTGTGFPFGSWLANTADSKWLAPTANAAQSYDPSSAGQYKWTLSFDLTGKDAASAFLAGRWASDNEGLVKLNGATISSGSSFSSWTDFSADDGFVAGMNTLDFIVTNRAGSSGNPTGVRVEFLESYAIAAAPVPEPSSYALILAGLAVVGSIARRRLC